MVKSLISNILLLIIVGISLALPSPGTFSQVQGWGNNPTNSEFWIYVPRGKPMAVVAAVHHCSGSAKIYWQGTKGQYQPLADKYNFVLVYPSSPHQGGCWDVSSKSSLSHSGNGDSNSIANMVRWATKQYDVTREKTFLFGTSSGAMMSWVISAPYNMPLY
jgi:acetylxylan esterase